VHENMRYHFWGQSRKPHLTYTPMGLEEHCKIHQCGLGQSRGYKQWRWRGDKNADAISSTSDHAIPL